MKFFDISLELSQKTIVWPGENKMARNENRGTAITSRLEMPSHFGTHVDAPKHFVFNKSGVDKIAINKLIGPAKIFAIKSKNLISLSEIKNLRIKAHDKILLKTRNSALLKKKTFTADYVSLSLEAAKYLAKTHIDLVGIDYFGIEAKSAPGHPVHKTLLKKNIVIIEGVDLSKVMPGQYTLAALPLKIKAGDGAPARVVLWK